MWWNRKDYEYFTDIKIEKLYKRIEKLESIIEKLEKDNDQNAILNTKFLVMVDSLKNIFFPNYRPVDYKEKDVMTSSTTFTTRHR